MVTDASTGDPVPGANVLVMGTTYGAATDIDGRYAIADVPAGPQTLRVTFVGYTRQEVPVVVVAGQTATRDVELQADAVGIDEVVVTGGGATVQSRRLSTTVESISPQQLAEIPATRIEDVLQANLANSQVRLSSGQPGTASLIRSRGVTSANSRPRPSSTSTASASTTSTRPPLSTSPRAAPSRAPSPTSPSRTSTGSSSSRAAPRRPSTGRTPRTA